MIAALFMVHFASAEPEAELSPVPDRSAPPAVSPAELLVQPEPEIHELRDGVVVWHLKVPSVRKVAVHVVLGRGLVEFEGGPTAAGRATGWMLDVAGGDYNSGQLALTADLHEVELWSRIGLHDGALAMVAPKSEIDVGLGLLRSVLQEPRFPKRDLKRYLKDQKLFYTVEAPSSQRRVVDMATAFGWFPGEHPYGARPVISDFDEIKPRDLRNRWPEWSTSTPMTIVVVGDIDYGDVEARLFGLVAGLGAGGPPSEALPVAPRPVKAYAVDMPGQAQVAVRMRTAAPPRAHEEAVNLEAATFVLGGHFLSRLNQVLREERGYTYGSRANYRSGPTWGTFTVSVAVGFEHLAETAGIIRSELDRMADSGPTERELEAARRDAVQDWNKTRQTAQSAANLLLESLEHRVSVENLRLERDALGSVTSDGVARSAANWFGSEDQRVWVLAGDRSTMEPELAEAGLSPVWLTPEQAVLGNF